MLHRAGRRAVLGAVLALAVTPASSAAAAEPLHLPGFASLRSCGLLALWCGDFAATGFRNWDGFDGNVSSVRARRRYFALLPSKRPLPTGTRYFRALVDSGAVKGGEAGQRSLAYLYPSDHETANKTGAYEGSEQWYHLSLYFPRRFRASPGEWNWLVVWHNWPNAPCCANLALTVVREGRGWRRRERLSLRVMGGGDPEHPLVGDRPAERNPAVRVRWIVGDRKLRRRHWYDVLMRVHWSYRHDTGLVEWWLDGRHVALLQMGTLFWYADDNENLAGATPGPGQAYLMVGYYRAGERQGRIDRSVTAVHHVGARRGPTRESVAY
jgi:hypothetical protein